MAGDGPLERRAHARYPASGSMLADGVYFYVIKLYDEPNSASLNLSGSVTILSN